MHAPLQNQRVFDLPERLSAKSDPRLIEDDEKHFAAIARCLEESIADLSARLEAGRRAPAGRGQRALDRDQEVHRITARLRALRRHGVDLCLGRAVGGEPGAAPVYIGRFGLTDREGGRLLLDWRSPAAEPFFGATHADPMGLGSRRRYRWAGGRVTDYWDEVFTPEGLEGHAALDDRSAFIASLGGNRSSRMRDVLGTIQADQDAVIRAGSRGTLVVDGGPGTGKTVVALHRTAYLLHSDPRLRHDGRGVLFVGPSRPYLDYVSDVLPGLGEDGVRTCILGDLVPEGAAAGAEADPRIARLKSSARLVTVVDAAVRFHETPPAQGLTVETPWADVWLTAGDWADAFGAVDSTTPHNEAHEVILDELGAILTDRLDDAGEDVTPALLRKSLRQNAELLAALRRAWPVLEAPDVVGDLWTVPAYLRHCAPWLGRDEVRVLQRPRAQAWTTSDLPWLDVARQRLGDPEAARRKRRQESAAAAGRERMADVISDAIATDDSEMLVMSMLRGQDLQSVLVDDGRSETDPAPLGADSLDGPFEHIVVDEAQELTDAEWQMLLLRNPSHSFTVVGDRAQARHGFGESWRERLERAGLDRVKLSSLTINYRTPEEVMAVAAPEILAVLPDAEVPTSVRRGGVPVVRGAVHDLPSLLDDWLASSPDGTACVIGGSGGSSGFGSPRVRFLTPELAKGLEFDLVVLVDPPSFGAGIEGAVDRYVAMTRATRQLIVLTR